MMHAGDLRERRWHQLQRAVRDASCEMPRNFTWSTSADDRRSPSVTVKKNVPPGTKLRRYRTILECTPDFASPYPGLRALTDREERRGGRTKRLTVRVPSSAIIIL